MGRVKKYFLDLGWVPTIALTIMSHAYFLLSPAYAGTNIQSAESLSESTESSGTRTLKVQLQFTPASSSNWLIIFSCEVGSSTADAANISVFNVVNGTDKTSVVEASGDTSIDYRSVISFYYVTGQSTQQTYKIEFNRTTSGTAKIRNARIVAIRTDVTGNDVTYNESLAEVANITTTYTSRASVTFAPATAGDYLILGFCEGSSDSTNSSWLARLNVDSATLYIPIDSTGYYTQEDAATTVNQPFFAARVYTLTAASHTIALQTAGESTGAADTRAHRVMAIRLTGVWTYGNSQTDAVATNTATTPGVRDTLNTTAPVQGKECLVLMAQHNKNSQATTSCYGEYEIADVIVGYNRHETQDTSDWWSGGVALHLSGVTTSQKLETTWYGDTTSTHSIKNSMIVYIEIENSPVSLSISVSPLTWGVGTVDTSTTQMSTSGNKIGVTNGGNVAETFTLQIYDEDDRNEWTHSSLETGAGNNIYVLSGIFCATADSPIQASFNEGASDDVLTTTQQTATSSKFAYAGGSDNAVAVPMTGQRSLWLRLDMPTAVSGTYAYEQHTVTVRISCQQS